jgi:UDP-N-acetylmuramoyl-tripeptide--D-alanyl-D-alanine ligase
MLFHLRFLQGLLTYLAAIRLKRENPQIVAVTGSVGKTTTKEAIFAVLSHHLGGKVTLSRSNLNNEFGVPLSILGIDHAPSRWEYPGVIILAVAAAFFTPVVRNTIRVQELGAERVGDIAALTRFLTPWLSVGVVTTVGPIHLDPGQFSSVAAIEDEKGRLIEALPEDGWAVLNSDNPATKRMAGRTKAKVIWFRDRGIDTFAETAKAVGKIFQIPAKEITAVLQTFHRPTGRLNELRGVKGSTIIDDTYNANPMSMEQALLILEKRPERRIAVLGDMLELGTNEELYHQQVGKFARGKCNVLVGVGRRARSYQPTYHFSTPLEAASFLKKFVRAEDTVLVKGSQSMRMEVVSEVLLANQADVAKLPRQTAAWKAKPFIQP